MKFIYITVDGTEVERVKPTLEDMQKFVGGYIEVHGNFYINEDGLVMGLEQNKAYPQFVGNIIKKVGK